MKSIQEIALEVCEKIGPVAMCKNPLAFSEMVVAAVDAERGKDAVAEVIEGGYGPRLIWANDNARYLSRVGDKLFLSPTIPSECPKCTKWGEAWDKLNETTGNKIAELESERDALKSAISQMIDAWESPPEGKHTAKEVDKWLAGPMMRAIKTCRKVVK